MSRVSLAIGAVLAAVVLVVGLVVLVSGPSAKHLAADFPNTVNLYPGAEVKVLGVTVGSVDSVAVRGTTVHVEMSYDGARSLPADAHAAIVPPSIVGDRFVQLSPPYIGGPALADGAQLDVANTEVPVELDEAYNSINNLAKALGPDGANSTGALSRLLTASAANLGGNGDAVHQTITQLSGAVSTLADARGDFAGTVTNLGALTATLAANDGQVRDLLGNLATVSDELNGQRDELRGATRNLNDALADIGHFVRDNRTALTDNIHGLAQVTSTVADHQRGLAELLDTAPLGLSNLYDLLMPVNYDPAHPGAVVPEGRTTVTVARFGGLAPGLSNQLGYLLSGLCTQLPAAQQQALAATCGALQRAGGDLGQVLTQLANPVLGPGLGSGGGASNLPGLLLGGGR
jgi:phospholipid/cholesterol/gamma-HCH transport system substrate-binding protein